jgi:phosphoribosylaminoimidazolecarboxamide formyltransferase/IMP cyclohydrolase
MTVGKIKRALISVYDKTGIVEFAQTLVDEFGIEIISTGGTASLLKENGIPVTLVEEVTDFPEMMDGRVKTLHPKIHAAILADRDNPEHMRQLKEQGIEPIDMVVVNLYPFEETVADPSCTFEQAIEMIDIGGPCLLRAAAKNHKHVWVVSEPGQYPFVSQLLKGEEACGDRYGRKGRSLFASAAFERTTHYDAGIAGWLAPSAFPSNVEVMYGWGPPLRYGENPHQKAALLLQKDRSGAVSLLEASGLDTTGSMSFNNYVDGDSALRLCVELSVSDSQKAEAKESKEGDHACVFVKHTNSCGVGVADDPLEAYRRAYLGDPNAAMGGILACNFDVDAEFARTVMETYQRWGKEAGAGGFFVEVWTASGFADDAVEIIRTAKKWGERVRLLSLGDMRAEASSEEEEGRGREYLGVHKADLEFKHIIRGFLMQSRDLIGLNEEQWKVVTKRAPTESEMDDLRLAWLICKHTKSNAITVCKGNMLIGNGAGQMSRVMSCRIATWLAKENGHAERLPGSVAASDAFFPFRDGPDILMDAGVTAIIQPGGSKRDSDTIAACDERNVAMIVTGTRHFKH